jgi:uncharacterized protein DUF2637
MGKHSELSNWQTRTVVAVVAVVAAGLAVYSAAASYDTVAGLAVRFGLSLPRLVPVGLDGGLFGAIIINIALIWLRKPVWWFGMVSRLFAVAVIAANGAAGWPRPVGVGLRIAAPVLFIVIVEAAQYVLLHFSDEAEQERRRRRDERIPFARWILAPVSTFVIWRRKKLWTDSRLPQAAIDAELSIIRLTDFYGADWREKAEADLVWMVQAGVNMDEVLDRVRKLTSTAAAARRQSRAASTAEESQPASVPGPAAPPSPAPEPASVPPASTADLGERSFEDLLREARAYRDELARAGERPSKDKLRLRLAVGSGKALELLRALKEDNQDDTREAVV